MKIQLRPIFFLLCIICLIFVSCKNETEKKHRKKVKKETPAIPAYPKVKDYTIRVIRKIPHQGKNYIQGLEIYNGFLYESTGLEKESSIKKMDMETGNILISKDIPEYFLEGLTVFDHKLHVLSWRKGKMLVLDPKDLSLMNYDFQYNTEGWGLCNDGTHLIMSDGSDKLYFRDPFTFKIVKTIQVKIEGNSIFYINELEYAHGKIYANVYTYNYIYIIDPESGYVTGRINANQLTCAQIQGNDKEAVLNGIAYNRKTETFYISGKRCPHIYEVVFE
jgi:glutaminyl-peptide cyclotransferase